LQHIDLTDPGACQVYLCEDVAVYITNGLEIIKDLLLRAEFEQA
jgi:hypothetical protein